MLSVLSQCVLALLALCSILVIPHGQLLNDDINNIHVNLWKGYSNVCGGAVSHAKKSSEFIEYLGDYGSYNECYQSCVNTSSPPTNQCESFTYYSNASNDTKNRLSCYARMNDPLWLPCTDEYVISGEVYWNCRNDIDCSLNGKCLENNGTCQCRSAWKGKRCQILNLLPAPVHGGFKQEATSSWGGAVIQNGNNKSIYHMFLSYFPNNCGHTADTMNSHVAHAISNGFVGPYELVEKLENEWSHEPFVTNGPNGETVVYFSMTRNEPYWPILCDCSANMNGTTPIECCQDTPNACTYDKPSNLSRHTTFMKYTKDLKTDNSTEWTESVNLWDTNSNASDTNFAAIIFENGTVLGLNRKLVNGNWSTLYFVTASNWSDPSSYIQHFDWTLFPQLVAPGDEDQFIYRDGNGYFHLLFHNMIPGPHGHSEYFSGAHAASQNGYNWTFFGYCYDNNVTFDDGTYHTFMSRERPHLVFDNDGVTPTAITNGVLWDANVANNDRSYTLLQFINTL